VDEVYGAFGLGLLVEWGTTEGCIGSGELSDDYYVRLMVKFEVSVCVCFFPMQ